MPDKKASGASVKQQLVALLSLTAVSTCIGISMKLSQVGGKYHYSPASAVVMTELFKLCSSAALVTKLIYSASKEKGTPLSVEANTFWSENLSTAMVFHQIGLAFAYAVVNLVTFSIFIYVPASSFFLMKAASPVITALMLLFLVGRAVSGQQWVSILVQCVGLIVTQYDRCSQSLVFNPIGYVLVAINIVVSCGAGVWNEHIIKRYGSSVNAQNCVLYSCGVLVGMVIFLTVPSSYLGGDQTLSFFEGYNWSVLAVIAANGSVGLVITAVYKYADVVVKTFGLAGSTVTLFMLEASGFLPQPKAKAGTSPLMSAVAASAVFYAAYLYIAPPRTVPAPSSTDAHTLEEGEAKEEDGAPVKMVPVPAAQDNRVQLLVVLAALCLYGSFAAPANCQLTASSV